jgi:RNA binding exosome subunit
MVGVAATGEEVTKNLNTIRNYLERQGILGFFVVYDKNGYHGSASYYKNSQIRRESAFLMELEYNSIKTHEKQSFVKGNQTIIDENPKDYIG